MRHITHVSFLILCFPAIFRHSPPSFHQHSSFIMFPRLLVLLLWHLCASLALSMPSTLKGSCACGSIQVNVNNISTDTQVVDCHCPNCRKHHVSAFSTFVVCDKESVTIHGDSLESMQHSCSEIGEVERLFCKNCLSKIVTRNNDKTMVCMGLIKDESIPKHLNTKWKKDRIKWQPDLAAKWPRARPRQTRHGLPPSTTVTGSCACGQCAYEIPFEHPMELQHCYCKLCRQLSGSAFQTWVPVDHGDMIWRNEPPLVRTTDHGQRHVCHSCGGVLTIVYDDDPDYVWPAAGGFDDATLPDEESKVSAYLDRVVHICCIWKQSWYQIPNDGLKRIDYAAE